MLWSLLAHLVLASLIADAAISPSPITKQSHCQDKCGNISIPYPFGLGDDPKCFGEVKLQLFCNTTSDPPLLYIDEGMTIPIIDISLLQGQLRVLTFMGKLCYSLNGTMTDWFNVNFTTGGYRISTTRNKFIAIGCDTLAVMRKVTSGETSQTGCISYCDDTSSVVNGSCTGIGCCEAAIPKGFTSIVIKFGTYYNHKYSWNFSRCSYAFLADNQWFKFSVSDLWEFPERMALKKRIGSGKEFPATPVVLDWAIGKLTCNELLKTNNQTICGENTYCSDSENGPGYHCHCKKGFEGNPYLLHGCTDVNECADPRKHFCVSNLTCHNTKGSYNCSCPPGFDGDGVKATKGGSGCARSKKQFPLTQLIAGICPGVVLLLIAVSWVYWFLQNRKLTKLKEKFFRQNGGLFLKQQLSSHDRSDEMIKIFTSEELKKSTGNYKEQNILGRGGYGTVYRGVLSNKRVVAIKKSKTIDKAQIEQFINEVLILSKINHRNVVKLLGCCLETEAPLLVYEYITNGTLHHHIHDQKHKHYLSWSQRWKIATETAEALAYLHSAASQPIIHRDVKSANILLDNNYTAKVSDFGASRLVALDQAHLSTLVQGTMGYLDPEYLQTSRLTDKSDVYSFGVVLVELLTGKKAVSLEKPEEQVNYLATQFVSSMKEDCLMELFDQSIVKESDLKEIHEVANLAARCLRLKGEERPTMKEVAMELQVLRVSQNHACMEHEETTHFLREPSNCRAHGITPN